jgi:hypothetical protein
MPSTIAPALTKTANELDMYLAVNTAGNSVIPKDLEVAGDLSVLGSALLPVLAPGSAGITSVVTGSGALGIQYFQTYVIGNTRFAWGNSTANGGINPFTIAFNVLPANSVPQQNHVGLFSAAPTFVTAQINNNISGSGVVNSVASSGGAGNMQVAWAGASSGESFWFFAIGPV